jgi:hypothetical protein
MQKFSFVNDVNYDITDIHDRIYQETFDYLDVISYPELKKQIDSLKSRTKNSNPLESVTKHISEAKQVLHEIFETYKNGVKIYTVAAFSIEAKSYIKSLGLSDKLDLIDITEPDINFYLAQTETKIFSGFNTAAKELENVCAQIFLNLNSIVYNSPVITVESSMLHLKHDATVITNSYSLKFEASLHKVMQRPEMDNPGIYFLKSSPSKSAFLYILV